MRKKHMIPTKRNRLKNKVSADVLIKRFLSLVDEIYRSNTRLRVPKTKMLTQEEIEKHFVRCEFDDTCYYCNDPKGGSYAAGYSNNECGCEVDYYICGKCASMAIKEMRDNCNEIM